MRVKIVVVEDVTPAELPDVLAQLEEKKVEKKVVFVRPKEKVVPSPAPEKKHGGWSAKHWKPEEDAMVRAHFTTSNAYFSSGKIKEGPVRIIAKKLGRTSGAVKTRAWCLKLLPSQQKQKRLGRPRRIDHEQFRKDYLSMSAKEAAKKNNTTLANAYSLARRLGIRKNSPPVKREEQHVKETQGEYMLRTHAKVPSAKPALFIPGKIEPPKFPKLENIGVGQADAQKSFESFCIASRKPRQLSYSSAFALFGVASFKQWYDFLNEVMAKSEEITTAIGVANLLKVVKMGTDAVLQYGG